MESSSSSNPIHLTLQNYDELIFGNKDTWIVDDTSACRVIGRRTPEVGKFRTEPVNGASFMLNSRTGQLYMKVFHSSEWDGLRHLPMAKMAKWRTAEEVADLVNSLPDEERPKQIVTTRKGMVYPLQAKLWAFPSIVIRGSELLWPFPSFLYIDKFGHLVNKATETQMVFFNNIYDDWLRRISSNTALSRLILILRALLVNNERAKTLLNPKGTMVIDPLRIWPSFTDDQWMEVEVALKHMISSEYAEKYNVNASESEIRDFILGFETPLLRQKRQLKEEIEAKRAEEIKRKHPHLFNPRGGMDGNIILGLGTGSFLA